MLEDLIKERRRKLEFYLKNADPYPAKVGRDFSICEILKNFSKLEKTKKSIFAAGRVRAWRDQGKILFGDIEDGSGRLQAVFNGKETAGFDLIKSTYDTGDFIEVFGKVFKTKRGEKSLSVKKARIIEKSLRPIPTDWYGLADIETRLRKRYLDLILNSETKEIFLRNIVFWSAVRHYLEEAKFLEVETPVLESIPGGADAEPLCDG